jgi:hypothetical protein
MHANEKIRSSFARVSSALAQRPAFGHGTGISKATITDGLTCEIREGNWTLIADMPEQAGSPGKLSRDRVYDAGRHDGDTHYNAGSGNTSRL